MNIQENQIIGQLVAHDYRTASVFKKYGIDFCCQGNRTINDACTKKNIDENSVLSDLNTVVQTPAVKTADYQNWSLNVLADYIEKNHHEYVREKSNDLIPYLEKICKVHGERHPELFEIKSEFNESINELNMHMHKEEKILFPYVRTIAATQKDNSKPNLPQFGTVKNPIEMMMREHEIEGDRFRKIESLSSQYTPPADACTTYRVTFAMLKEFEQDLHLHIHLENNILFPNAIKLENELISS
ncbi:MAG TPA: iron-sulfur cluster repair di-iron protein [Saprospiraceae bacterium]|jgi:regulator of cell morphogenesis and NO signaling|nr:iron-sulfur cluster repair di-iron protein [Saprospiraceae bacterium]MBK8886302.1 iron-sulfur cluster repair di-iron protein [Saprospiraceae bacterium]MBK9581354.1 iron-sulfur cluster repair di-iron protein [Saprospiraceae bacterium]MBP6540156.1 iron-sulfur cluster repair di-iron protein [Saprospiraceae bacterium]HMT53938.1 iron-sulfur cluster repair di-iron protein [Saprospiraceae bacterium]